MTLLSRSPAETQEIGKRLGKLAQRGDVFLLTGKLGAGKTCLTQGIAWGLGVQEYARSPTFVLVTEYQGRLPLYHIDLYRPESVEEILDLGLDDYLYGEGVCVVEWADKALDALSREHLLISISNSSEEKRTLVLEPQGERYERLLETFQGEASPSGIEGGGQ